MASAEGNSSHRNSVAWQKGMELAKVVYSLTVRFPPDERFGLTNQLRRAAVSIPSNIAEAQAIASEELKILKASLVTLRAKRAARKQR